MKRLAFTLFGFALGLLFGALDFVGEHGPGLTGAEWFGGSLPSGIVGLVLGGFVDGVRAALAWSATNTEPDNDYDHN